jgi:hypothetical protein
VHLPDSNHHTKYHRDALLDVAIFMACVAKGWGIRYTGSWTTACDHPGFWLRVCNKLGAGGASHNDDFVTMFCTGGAGVIGNRGLISGFCHSLKWVSLSTLSSEVKVLTRKAANTQKCAPAVNKCTNYPLNSPQSPNSVGASWRRYRVNRVQPPSRGFGAV